MKFKDHIYPRIVAAKVYIDSHFCQRIDLDQIAREACLSPFHFHRIFKEVYQYTPHRYLIRKRVALAAQLLASDRQVQDVCREVGFESLGSFSTLFRRETGETPTLFRSRLMAQSREARVQPRRFIPDCFYQSYYAADDHHTNYNK